MSQKGQKRLGAVELEKRAHSAQSYRGSGLVAGAGMLVWLGWRLQESEYRHPTQKPLVAQAATRLQSASNQFCFAGSR